MVEAPASKPMVATAAAAESVAMVVVPATPTAQLVPRAEAAVPAALEELGEMVAALS